MKLTVLTIIFTLFLTSYTVSQQHKLINLDNFLPQQLTPLLNGDWKALLQSTAQSIIQPKIQSLIPTSLQQFVPNGILPTTQPATQTTTTTTTVQNVAGQAQALLQNTDQGQTTTTTATTATDNTNTDTTNSNDQSQHKLEFKVPQHLSDQNIFKRHFMSLNQQHLERHKISL